WLVDALKATGYAEPLEPVFARGQMYFGAAMLVGTIGGGLLGDIRLYVPYLVRAALVVPLFLLAWFRMPELGFTPRALELRLVAPLSRVVRTRTGVLILSTGAQAVLAVACGLLTNFFAVVGLYLLYGVAIGLALPVKQAYLNAHIPSAQRATIISLDSMFANSGGVLGQTAWGWVAGTRSIGTAWTWSGLTLLLGIPLYCLDRRRDRH